MSTIDLRQAKGRHPAVRHARRRHPAVDLARRPETIDATVSRPGRTDLEVANDESLTPPVFWTILCCVIALCCIGLIFVLSASSVRANHKLDSSFHWFTRQVFFVIIGGVAMFIASRIPYQWWLRRGPLALVLAAFGLFLVLLPTPLRHVVNGSKRWLGPELISLQPSELAKLAVVLWLAGMLAKRVRQIREPRAALYPAMAVLALLAALIISEPDLGTTILISCVTFIMLAVAGVRLDKLALLALPAVAMGLLLSMWGYRRARMLAFLDPWAHASREGWQTLQSQVGIASGGWFGVGIGNGRSKWGFLPEAHTDFIFSVIGEEFGLIGSVAVISLFLALVVAGISAGRRSGDLAGLLLAVGISTWIGLQALINISVTVGLLPNKGITLPFVSYGGSSLIVTMVAAGVLLSVARTPATRPARSSRTRGRTAASRES